MRLPPAAARLLPAPLPAGAGLWPRRGAARPSEQVENKTKGKLQKQICQVVLDHFEKQYTAELGDKWTSVRDVLTCPSCWQYAILLNKFSQSAELENMLRVKGYHLAFRGTLPYLPRSLKCYISRTPRRFPAQKHQTGQFHCNEYDDLRSRWLKQTMESFIPDPLVNLITVSKQDGRQIGDFKPESYDKVLVDAPCSNDRSWLFSSDTQQAKLRLIQRKELSSLQFQLLSSRNNSACGKTPHLSGLLRSAIKALRPGGSLVYSTCTLSKAENGDVINLILKSCANVMPVDISEMAKAVSQEFTFLCDTQQHELLVLPEKGKAWGPMYVAKLKKI